jgi:hypothetical protein
MTTEGLIDSCSEIINNELALGEADKALKLEGD